MKYKHWDRISVTVLCDNIPITSFSCVINSHTDYICLSFDLNRLHNVQIMPIHSVEIQFGDGWNGQNKRLIFFHSKCLFKQHQKLYGEKSDNIIL